MDNDLKSNSSYSNTIYSSPNPIKSLKNFLEILDNLEKINNKISTLKLESENIKEKINSFDNKICNFIQNSVKIAYMKISFGNDFRTLYALAKYDKTGIFNYFKHIHSEIDNCDINELNMSITGNTLIIWYGDGDDNDCFSIPRKIVEEINDENMLSEKIVDMCRETIQSLSKSLESVKFGIVNAV